MLTDYNTEKYNDWEVFHGIKFFRKLEYETAFDGIVKIYSLSTENEEVNKLLSGKFFHRFAYQTENGLLLRQFKAKKSWPKTRLVFLDFSKKDLVMIAKTNSSYDSWTVKYDKESYKIFVAPEKYLEFKETD